MTVVGSRSLLASFGIGAILASVTAELVRSASSGDGGGNNSDGSSLLRGSQYFTAASGNASAASASSGTSLWDAEDEVEGQAEVGAGSPTREIIVAGVPVTINTIAPGRGERVRWIAKLSEAGAWTDATMEALCGSLPGESKCTLRGRPSSGMLLFGVSATRGELRKMLQQNPGIEWVEQEGFCKLPEPVFPSHGGASHGRSRPSWTNWNIDRIGQRAKLSGGNSFGTTYDPLADGLGIHVYVADTGIRTTHEEFEGRAVPTLEIDEHTGEERQCKSTDTACAADQHSHGTHVAGTVGGKTYGVARKATIHAVKVCNAEGICPPSHVVAALAWIADHAQRPAVINLSLGHGYQDTKAYEYIIQVLSNRGITVVVAAGNNGWDARWITPANVNLAITVGATQQADSRADFSNWGRCVDIWAPGQEIMSAIHTSDSDAGMMNGTSMAAPHVAGAAAQLLQRYTGITPETVRCKLLEHATDGSLSSSIGFSSPNKLLYIRGVPPCIGGWRAPEQCVSTFSYSGTTYNGCTPGWWRPWCCHDESCSSGWSRCDTCDTCM